MQQFKTFARVPLIGFVFYQGEMMNKVVLGFSEIGSEVIKLGNRTKELNNNILGDEPYDVNSKVGEIALGMDSLYKRISFLQAELNGNNMPWGYGFIKRIHEDFNISQKKGEMETLMKLTHTLPDLLGSATPKTYLVLFQNNMELRPTGGFIGSFALVTFDGGRLTDINIMDVYSADGQLKGYVAPPLPIETYLKTGGWYLRDSNWDADFPSSAQKAEWFIDKEIDKRVDGVFSVDLETMRAMLGVIGEITLTDFDKTINKDNFYQITQEEVEKDFFPGSRKKTTFLTALANEFMNQLTNPNKDKYLKLAGSLYRSLNTKNVQVFLHNIQAQSAITDLGWDGAVRSPVCLRENCQADWGGVVEANVGVNKANYFVKRSANLDVYFENMTITKKLELDLKSTADKNLGHSGKYFTYIRVLAPGDSEFLDVEVLSSDGNETITPTQEVIHGRKEAGVYVEVESGTEKKIVFSWSNKSNLGFDKQGEYRLFWRKQAGTVSDPISVNINTPKGYLFTISPAPSLTQQGLVSYNTTLSRDFFSSIIW